MKGIMKVGFNCRVIFNKSTQEKKLIKNLFSCLFWDHFFKTDVNWSQFESRDQDVLRLPIQGGSEKKIYNSCEGWNKR